MPQGLTLSTTEDDEKSRFRLAQIWSYVKFQFECEEFEQTCQRIIEELLKEDFNVNYKIERNLQVAHNDHLDERACTALHMIASNDFHISTFNKFVERGVDVTIQNRKGQTALHLLLNKYTAHPITSNSQASYIKSILSTHVKFQNPVNPRDSNGISHLHAACIVNHIEVINWFLYNGSSIDEAVNRESPYFPGYSPLHFAALFDNFEAAQLLVSRGVNVNVTDASGMSPIDVLVERRFRKAETFTDTHSVEADKFREARLKDVANNEKMIQMLLERHGLSSVGLSRLHVACTLENLSIAEILLQEIVDVNHAVPLTSPIYPGYTMCHFAALNSIAAVKLLLAHNAHFGIEGADGLTPLDICLGRYSIQDIHSILFRMNYCEDICLTDGKTKLLDLLLSMRDRDQFISFLREDLIDETIPKDSALWPGYTILHLAVILSRKNELSEDYEETIITECLMNHMDVDAQNARGQTPIHLAFRLGKKNIVILFIKHLYRFQNFIDDDNLSYLHIACSVLDDNFVKILLQYSEPNIAYKGKRIPEGSVEPGFTPLHVAVITGSKASVTMLLRCGANLHAVDSYGLTPIHWLLNINEVAIVLLGGLLKNPVDCLVDRIKLSYLHVACAFGGAEIIERLLDLGSDINAAINVKKTSDYLERRFENGPLAFLSHFSGLTPLHCALRNPNSQAVKVLLRRGADVSAKFSSSPDSGIFLEKNAVVRQFMPYLWDNEDMLKCMETRFGMTKLHVACYMKNEEAVKSILTEGWINVNTQIHANSPIFAGFTPLHLLMTVSHSNEDDDILAFEYFTIGTVINLLLVRGADVTTTNTAGDTPIHLFFKYRQHFTHGDLCKNILFNAPQDFNLNPVNVEGLSHFHIACFWHQAEAVEKFLQHGSVDVNGQIDFFAKFNSGCTPLHLTLDHEMTEPSDDWTKLSQIVYLLLVHGANPRVKDVLGDTPLHKKAVLGLRGLNSLELLIRYGADMKNENVRGETPLELWTSTHLSDYARIFEINDYKLNCWNRISGEGYVAKLFLTQNRDVTQSSEFNIWVKSSDAKLVDVTMNRSAIQNSVAMSHHCNHVSSVDKFIYVIESLMKRGIDIDRQDTSGRTALHSAVQNVSGIKALLKCGADININDYNGQSVYAHLLDHMNERSDDEKVLAYLFAHVEKLRHLGLEVSECNRNLADDTRKLWVIKEKMFRTLSSEIELAKTLKIEGSSLTLFDFLSETSGISVYPFLTKTTQQRIDDFFKSIDFRQFRELDGIIKLQFRKAKKRLV